MISSQSIIAFFQNNTVTIIEDLTDLGLTMPGPDAAMVNPKGVFNSKSVVVTGSFTDYSRKEIEQMVETNGGKVASAVSKKTTYLVVGAKAGSKVQKAKKFQVQMLTLEVFMDMVKKE